MEKEQEKQLAELDELIKKYNSDALEYESELERLKASLADEERIITGRINEIQAAVLDRSSRGLVEDVLKMPVQKTEQLQSNILKLGIALKSAKQKAILYAGAKNTILAEIREEEINTLTKKTFKDLGDSIKSFSAAQNHFFKTTIPGLDEAYEADPDFFDVNGRAQKLGLSPVLSHVIANRIKAGTTHNVNFADVIDGVRVAGIEYPAHKILGRTYEKDQDYDRDSYFGIAPSDEPPWQDPKQSTI